MSRLGMGQSRGNSRGIVYKKNMVKSCLPAYGSSTKKGASSYEHKSNINPQVPPSLIPSTKSTLYSKDPYSLNYDFTLQRQVRQMEKGKMQVNSDEKKDKTSQDFIIRKIREKQSRKEDKDLPQKMTDSLLKHDEEKHQKEKLAKQKIQEIQRVRDEAKKHSQNDALSSKLTTTNTTSSSKYNLKTIGLVGLSNLGNTCFMNSILQCLFNLPEFNEYFLDDDYVNEMKNGGRVAQAYARTVKMMRSSSSRCETPSEIKNAVGEKKSRFLGYSQQDAQQFLAALLELLSQDLNRSSKPKYRQLTADASNQTLKQISEQWWNYNKQRQDSVVCDYFSGQMLSRVVCSRCRHESLAFDNTWDLALGFSDTDDGLKKMISNFLKEEVIADDYYCIKCKCLRECRRKVDFYRLPKVLVLQLKRFSYGHWRKVKLNNPVKIESRLDLSSLITSSKDPSVQNPVYNLVGMVNHSGGIDFGHYTAQCKNPINNKWYNFDDQDVSETRVRESFESTSPYLLFYVKEH